MKKKNRFEMRTGAPQKMTKARLAKAMEELGLKYKIDGEGSDFQIIIDQPKEQKGESQEFVYLSEARLTEFESEKIMPLIRKINESSNFKCILEKEDGRHIIVVSKKYG